MRAFPLAWRGLAIATAGAVVATWVTTTGARADDPSVAELQVRLVQSRQHLNSLYAQSAMASERLNGATYDLDQARASVVARRADLAKARKSLDAQRAQVAELTVQELQEGTSTSALGSMLGSDGPRDLLERASAYSSIDQALTARLAALDARQVVHAAAAREARTALDEQEEAAARRKAAQVSIDGAIRRAEDAAVATRKQRRNLLAQLATVQRSPLAEVTRAQDAIDRHLDESGPDVPAEQPSEPDPRPTMSHPSTPKPPPADPPTASGSKVETAIAFAKRQLGEKYVWGGAGPSSWDCSGLTMRAWQAAGVNLSHYAGSQYTQTKKVAVSRIKRGDLLFWSDGGPGSIYHVALYLGGGQMIHAPRPGRSVEIVPLSYWIQPDLASRPG